MCSNGFIENKVQVKFTPSQPIRIKPITHSAPYKQGHIVMLALLFFRPLLAHMGPHTVLLLASWSRSRDPWTVNMPLYMQTETALSLQLECQSRNPAAECPQQAGEKTRVYRQVLVHKFAFLAVYLLSRIQD